MKNVSVGLLIAVMICYVAYRAFTTLVFLPFAGSIWSADGVYFLSLVLLSVVAITLSFKDRDGMAAILGSVVGLAALVYWSTIFHRTQVGMWSDFMWFAVPEICFSLATITKWRVCSAEYPPDRFPPVKTASSVAEN